MFQKFIFDFYLSKQHFVDSYKTFIYKHTYIQSIQSDIYTEYNSNHGTFGKGK